MKNEINEPEVKMLKLGQSSLSDAENLSLIIRGRQSLDRAYTVLKKVNNSYKDLVKLSYNNLLEEGLSNKQALSIIASFELSKRKYIYIANELTHIHDSSDIRDVMIPFLKDLDHEEFWTIYMNRSVRIIKCERISQGGISGTVTDIKMIIKKAIDNYASAIVICHNHPSGNLNPSESDTKITKKIKEASSFFDIELMDHIIITDTDYYSFADNGIL
jgi:DNA repair protein RadC